MDQVEPCGDAFPGFAGSGSGRRVGRRNAGYGYVRADQRFGAIQFVAGAKGWQKECFTRAVEREEDIARIDLVLNGVADDTVNAEALRVVAAGDDLLRRDLDGRRKSSRRHDGYRMAVCVRLPRVWLCRSCGLDFSCRANDIAVSHDGTFAFDLVGKRDDARLVADGEPGPIGLRREKHLCGDIERNADRRVVRKGGAQIVDGTGNV